MMKQPRLGPPGAIGGEYRDCVAGDHVRLHIVGVNCEVSERNFLLGLCLFLCLCPCGIDDLAPGDGDCPVTSDEVCQFGEYCLD